MKLGLKALVAGVLGLCLTAAVGHTVNAQKGQKKNKAGAISQAWLTKLNLNTDQQAKVKAATDAYQTELQKAEALTTPKEKKKATRGAQNAFEGAVKAVLTPDQQKQIDSWMAEARDFQTMGPIGNQLVGLNLTTDQKAKIKEIAAKYQPEIEKIRDQAKISMDKKASQMEVRAQTKKMMTEIKTLLTPDQQKQLQPLARKKAKASA